MKYLAVLFIVLFMMSCAEGYSPLEDTILNSECKDLVYYPIEYSTEGAYVSSRGEVYKVTMHFENREDAVQSVYTVKDLGRAANSVYEAWIKQDLPNPESVRDYLSTFHVIVLHTKANEDTDFARLHNPDLFAENPGTTIETAAGIGAYVYWAGNSCFPDVPEEAHFFIVFRHVDFLSANLLIIIHELLHPACFAGLGDSQGNHDNELIWNHLGYDYNIQDVAANIFALDYFYNQLEK